MSARKYNSKSNWNCESPFPPDTGGRVRTQLENPQKYTNFDPQQVLSNSPMPVGWSKECVQRMVVMQRWIEDRVMGFPCPL